MAGLPIFLLLISAGILQAQEWSFMDTKDFITDYLRKSESSISTENSRDTSPTQNSRDIPLMPTQNDWWDESPTQYPVWTEETKKWECMDDGLFPNPEKCTSYIQCSNVLRYEMTCPTGLHFNKETKRCEAPCDAHCDRSLACRCGWSSCASSPIPTRYSEVDDSSEDSQIPTLNTETECEKDGLYPHPEDCSRYIQCSDDQKFEKRCPSFYHFNRKTRRCERPCDAHCDKSIACQCGWDSCANDICRLPAVKGPCESYMTKYYYDHHQKRCRKFNYGGCKGNKNRFNTKEECERRCSKTAPETECVRDGLYPNPKNCTTYIHCANGLKYVMPCPASLHFNHKTKRCERPCDAKCDQTIACECDWPSCEQAPACTEDGLYPNPEDCTTFIHCFNGMRSIMPCPQGRHFSEETKRCEARCEAHCDQSLACECGWPSCESSPTVCKLPSVSGQCGSRIPRFYFDESEGQCREFTYSGCGGNGNNFETMAACEQYCSRSMAADTTCAKNGIYPNPEDCSTYIHCINGQKLVMPCPAGLHFSVETMRCEDQCNAYCDSNLACECQWDTCESSPAICKMPLVSGSCGSSITRYYFDWSEGQCEEFTYSGCGGNRNNFETLESCQQYCGRSLAKTKECRRNGIYPNPEDCTTYIQCSNGRKLVMSCPPGLHYSKETKRCETPCDAHCDQSKACECEWPSCVSKFESSCEKNGLYPNPRDCSSYILCSDGVKYVKPCPPGLHFDSKTKNCDVPCEAHCDETLACECGWSSCVQDICDLKHDAGPCKMLLMRYYYDSESHTCKKFVYGGCHGNENRFLTKKACMRRCPIKAEEDSRDLPIATEDSTWSDMPEQSQIRNEDTDDWECVKDGLYPHPEKCSSYIQCSSGVKYEMPCPTGLHFSKKTKLCEVPCDAHCDENLACECRWESCDRIRAIVDDDFTCPTRFGKYPYFFDCTAYYECKDGVGTLKYCKDDEAFHYMKATCVEKEKAKCLYRCSEPNGAYPYLPDCQKYLKCTNYVSTMEQCPSGQMFDIHMLQCTDEETATCSRV